MQQYVSPRPLWSVHSPAFMPSGSKSPSWRSPPRSCHEPARWSERGAWMPGSSTRSVSLASPRAARRWRMAAARVRGTGAASRRRTYAPNCTSSPGIAPRSRRIPTRRVAARAVQRIGAHARRLKRTDGPELVPRIRWCSQGCPAVACNPASVLGIVRRATIALRRSSPCLGRCSVGPRGARTALRPQRGAIRRGAFDLGWSNSRPRSACARREPERAEKKLDAEFRPECPLPGCLPLRHAQHTSGAMGEVAGMALASPL